MTHLSLELQSALVQTFAITLPQWLLVDSLHPNLSKPVKLSLFLSLAVSPQLACLSDLALGVPQMLYVGALMTSFWAVLEARPEIGAASFGVAASLS